MRQARLGKGLQVGASAAAVATALALLAPEAVAPWPPADEALARPKPRAGTGAVAAQPWLRMAGALPEPPEPPPLPPAPPAPLPPAPSPAIVPPPEAVVPDPPFTYLGRIDQDGRRHVFLGLGAEAYVVAIGEAVDAQWALEQAGPTRLVLRYLPLNKTRILALP